MAINIPEQLITLGRSAAEEQHKALAEPYTAQGWAAWREAAAAFQLAVTEHAETADVSRVELEMAVKKAVLHPEPEGI
ncbi:hypothetical protein ACIOHC_10880 [Streptomyces sp. NPDC088252]|uniref:hypothetical protein n=1 Tax=unclassified Streptomyces TaxID=2593676 RepID=UPI00382186B9